MRTPEQIAAEVVGNAPDGLELVMRYAELRATIVATIEADRTQYADLISEARALLVRYYSIESDDDPGYHERVDTAIDSLTMLERLLDALQPRGVE